MSSDIAHFVDNNRQKLTLSSFDGYKIFQIRSKEKTGSVRLVANIFNNQGKKIASEQKDIQIIDQIQTNVKTSQLQVGKKEGSIHLRFTDKNGKLLSGLNSRIYTHLPKQYANFSKPYVEVKNGSATIPLTTQTLAGKNIPISFQIEGLSQMVTKNITILPEQPIKVDVLVEKSKMEANPNEKTKIIVELKDRYNNLVFNDSSHTFQLQTDNSSSLSIKNTSNTLKNGTGTVEAYGTQIPGLTHFAVTVSPDLAKNSFQIADKKETLTVQ